MSKPAVELEKTEKSHIKLRDETAVYRKALGKILTATHKGAMASQCSHCVVANDLAMDAIRAGNLAAK